MINHKSVMVVLPAYNAAKTLERTLAEISPGVVDQFLLVDDASQDDTVTERYEAGNPLSRPSSKQGIRWQSEDFVIPRPSRRSADIVVMLHPDYQYSPKMVGAMSWLVASNEFDIVLGSRILGTGALKGGMPLYKYVANRFLTAVENVLLGIKLSEYHTGYRAFSRQVLEALPLLENSTTSSLITRCWPRRSPLVFGSARSVAPRGISPKRPRSTSAVPSFMGSAYWARRSHSGSIDGGFAGVTCSRPRDDDSAIPPITQSVPSRVRESRERDSQTHIEVPSASSIALSAANRLTE